MDMFGLVYGCNQSVYELILHQVEKTEGTLQILARLKDQERKGIEYH